MSMMWIFLVDGTKERFKLSRLAMIRKRTRKEVKLAGMCKEIVVHLVLCFSLQSFFMERQEQLSL